ncbi:cytochrome-c peroxidase [Endozoicomonas sp. SM1973]|uniref:Cytochrome-c peroxidase n=1 Tax=Spartinivicinus marinus TaxID=2994442 RepID=A0A853I175_9GAMM|nr:cytochrome c peroxidase [Spartinivicinus marinus]MCX4027459.1 cytochrome-c peroxidase [Spartinivicinus marinus]NYZ66369.1 cytochrome-c peroxidase [Spartinivicinus marinus]
MNRLKHEYVRLFIILVFILNQNISASQFPPLTPLGKVPEPPDNKTTAEKIALGKLLFFDGRLGGDGSTSCASCHVPEMGWDWPGKLSLGYPGTIHWRNAQTIINAAYYDKLFWAGASKSLEEQAKSAAKGAVAGNGEDDLMEARLALIPEYRQQFKTVFGDEWPKINNAWNAIAAFERTLVQTDTPLDRFLNGDNGALTIEQIAGKKLFEGKAGCIQCHNGALASDQAYYNIGVPPSREWQTNPLAQITMRYELYAKGMDEQQYRHTKADPGAYFRTKHPSMKGKFRTPSLRYTLYTAPYMHNGELANLTEVIDFYDAGGFTSEGRTTAYPATKSKLIKPLGLNNNEKKQLLAFLQAFSGKKITIERPSLPAYKPLFSKNELKDVKK